MGSLVSVIELVNVKDIVDILIVAFIIYQLIIIVRGTRAVQMLIGMGALSFLFGLGVSYKLYTLNWLLDHFFQSFFVLIVILFQDEIRTALASFGGRGALTSFWNRDVRDPEIDEIVDACGALSREKIGALIVFENRNGLQNYMSTGTKLGAEIHSDILYAIFQSSSPLHDGAVIISGDKIAAAGAFLPLSKSIELDRHMGTRHRAALGITELTDAYVVTVSEESGRITVCHQGEFYGIGELSDLRNILYDLIKEEKFTYGSELRLTERDRL